MSDSKVAGDGTGSALELEPSASTGPAWTSAAAFVRGPDRRLIGLLALVAVVLAVSASLYHIYVPLAGAYDTFFLRPVHLLLIGGLAFISIDIRSRPRDFTRLEWSLLVDAVLLALFAFAIVNVARDPTGFDERYGFGEATRLDTALGGILVLLVLELSRRCIGWPITIFVAVTLAYGVWGGHSFSIFRHRPIPLEDLLQYLYMTTFGIFGAPVGAIATYVFLFIIFGAFVERSKGGLLIQRIGLVLTGRSPGGPAKVAVLTSSMFGTISGSALANVMATGSFTIPLMKRIGFKPHNAGAIEAAASSGGQLTPPIMGAVAFVMADITGIPYADIIIAAALPAALFYASLFIMVDLTARREGMVGVPEHLLPRRGDIRQLLHLLLPLAILVATLLIGFSPMMAALTGIASAILVAAVRRITRMNWRLVLEGLNEAAQTTIIATVACAAAGIVVGVINVTGLGLRLSSELINLTHGYAFLALVLVMITCVVLGMGMPTVAAYIITVAIGGPVLESLGIPTLAAHLFVLYYAVLSLITPPVMVATFGAAALAKADVMATGFAAVKFAGLAFLMPFIFVYNPELLIIAGEFELWSFLHIAATAFAGALVFGMGVSGYPARGPFDRFVCLLIAYLLVDPAPMTDVFGLGAAALLIVKSRLSTRRAAV